MNRKLIVSALVVALCALPQVAPAQQRSHYIQLATLADISGLRLRQTRMLFAAARTSYPEYRFTFNRVEARFIKAVGRERYERLQAGLPVSFEREVDGRKVAVVIQLAPSGS